MSWHWARFRVLPTRSLDFVCRLEFVEETEQGLDESAELSLTESGIQLFLSFSPPPFPLRPFHLQYFYTSETIAPFFLPGKYLINGFSITHDMASVVSFNATAAGDWHLLLWASR